MKSINYNQLYLDFTDVVKNTPVVRLQSLHNYYGMLINQIEDEDERQGVNCNTCRAAFNRAVGYVYIDNAGELSSALLTALSKQNAGYDIEPIKAQLLKNGVISNAVYTIDKLERPMEFGAHSKGGFDHIYLSTPALNKSAQKSLARMNSWIRVLLDRFEGMPNLLTTLNERLAILNQEPDIEDGHRNIISAIDEYVGALSEMPSAYTNPVPSALLCLLSLEAPERFHVLDSNMSGVGQIWNTEDFDMDLYRNSIMDPAKYRQRKAVELTERRAKELLDYVKEHNLEEHLAMREISPDEFQPLWRATVKEEMLSASMKLLTQAASKQESPKYASTPRKVSVESFKEMLPDVETLEVYSYNLGGRFLTLCGDFNRPFFTWSKHNGINYVTSVTNKQANSSWHNVKALAEFPWTSDVGGLATRGVVIVGDEPTNRYVPYPVMIESALSDVFGEHKQAAANVISRVDVKHTEGSPYVVATIHNWTATYRGVMKDGKTFYVEVVKLG